MSPDGDDSEMRPSSSLHRSYPLPRPPLWIALPIIGSLDAVAVISIGILAPVVRSNAAPSELLLVVVGALRACVVGCVGSARAVRSLGWAVALVGTLSLLAFFSRLNALVLSSEHVGLATIGLLTTAAVCPLIEWTLFVVVVGVSQRRNPFAGPRLGLGNNFFGGWAEQEVDVNRVRELGESEFSGVLAAPLEGDQTSASEPSSDDEDDPFAIQDLPKPPSTPLTPQRAGVRSRTRSTYSHDSRNADRTHRHL